MDLKLLALYAMFSLLGYFAHMLKSMKQAGWTKSIPEYFRAYPKQTLAAFLCCVGAFAGVFEMGQLNMTSAFALGYMADSAADTISGRTIRSLK